MNEKNEDASSEDEFDKSQARVVLKRRRSKTRDVINFENQGVSQNNYIDDQPENEV